ncbi:MAG: patatin-like phospholipase family protein [Acidobacteria bacterium]|nr:patatin-like phospholipase family protein [Acidobacteriota bacterium]
MAEPLDFAQVLAEEYKYLRPELDLTGKSLEQIYEEIHKLPRPTAALCLSGGGIRSATFGLGVLQGLAKCGLLEKFDYLSTVSGGGYIGGWLSAWLKHAGPNTAFAGLKQERPPDALAPEAEPIRNLRAYSNYLSPRMGLFSADVWTIAGTYLRNLLLNLLILVPMLLGVLMIPRIAVWVVRVAESEARGYPWAWPLLALAGYFGFVLATRYAASDLPGDVSCSEERCRSQSDFVKYYLTPLLAAALLLTASWALLAPSVSPSPSSGVCLISALFFAGANCLGWLWGARKRLSWAIPTTLATGFAGGYAATYALTSWWPQPSSEDAAVAYVILAAPALLGMMLLFGVLFVGVASYKDKWLKDQDREWWARSGAWVLIAAVAWLFGSVIVLYGPEALLRVPQVAKGAIAAAGGLSGIAAALIGYSARTAARDGQGGKSRASAIASQAAGKLLAPLFVAWLLAMLSLATTYALQAEIRWSGTADDLVSFHRTTLTELPELIWGVVLAAAALPILGWLLGVLFSVNRFSMSGFYRNRLIRAYLGASRGRKARHPHPFTGFDPAANLKLQELGLRPLHIINITLNLCGGKELAWQNRKAVSFTASPLHVGSSYPVIGYQKPEDYTTGGLTLGMAMTVSGAAVSPNMGYHSSPALTFLMALFDVRLGAWLPNPGDPGKDVWKLDGPSDPLVLLEETLGMTDEKHSWVYLSDGGHFENLGLYEMLRRRVKFIVLSDASEDHAYTFPDLANALQKIRVDLGVRIEPVKEPQIWHKSTPGTKRCAVYRIHYEDVEPDPQKKDRAGWLLYLKPGISGNEPRDILKYSNEHTDFPHDTTADQWFDEAQFECYRALGLLSVEEICHTPGVDATSFPLFFPSVVASYLK